VHATPRLPTVTLPLAALAALTSPLQPLRAEGDWVAAAHQAPAVTLKPHFWAQCRRPCQHVGFSFLESGEEVDQMVARGANATLTGGMWIPVEAPDQPYGVGHAPTATLRGLGRLAQSFRAREPFVAVGLACPTFNTTGSGCTLSLRRGTREDWVVTGRPPRLASQAFRDLQDNQIVWLPVGEQPAGVYTIEQSEPTGAGVGVWTRGGDPYPDGTAYADGAPFAGVDLELWLRAPEGREVTLVPPADDHVALRLAGRIYERLLAQGMHIAYSVGDWNNGFFPYYPDWFWERFPDAAMLDAPGRPFLAGMFEKQYPWPSIEHPAIVSGASRYIRDVVTALRDEPDILYWVMGGEALYATYVDQRRWMDFGPNALAHYRAWLQQRYGTVAALNAAWGTQVPDFGAVGPSAPPTHDAATLDWLRYRNRAMAERFQWHFRAAKGADPGRLVVTSNHGDLFTGLSGVALGCTPAEYAAVSDGWELGQIIGDDDPTLYNLLWMHTVGAFGKPLCPVRLAYKRTDPRARGGGTSYTPAAARRYFWESVGTGSWHLGFIQWSGSLPDGEWGVKGTPAEAEIGRLLERWHQIEPLFDGAWPVAPRVGLLLSEPTWLLEGYQPVWQELHAWAMRNQVPLRFLYDAQIAEGALDDLQVVISADNRLLDRDVARELARFAARGGKLLLCGENAVWDERAQPYTDSPLAETRARDLPHDRWAATLRAELGQDADWPVRVRATGDPVWRTTGTDLTGTHDTPVDLAGHTSVSQTFVAAHERLVSVGVSCPTYTKTVTDCTLTIQVLAGGPGGPVIAERIVPTADLTDNAWHDVPVDRTAPVGATYYVRLVTPAELPPQLIGVWCCAEDRYAGGSLHMDDQPVPGDMRVRVRYAVPSPPAEVLEVFPLHDGAGLIVAVTNIGREAVQAEVTPADGALSPEFARYEVVDVLQQTVVAEAERADAHAAVTVPAEDSAVLCFRPVVTAAQGGELLAAVHRLPGTPSVVAALQQAQEALATGRPAKGAAACLRALAVVEAQVAARVEDGRLSVSARMPVPVQSLAASMVPLIGFRAELREAGGEWRAEIPCDTLPRMYDYGQQRYVPYSGVLELMLEGRAGDGRKVFGTATAYLP